MAIRTAHCGHGKIEAARAIEPLLYPLVHPGFFTERLGACLQVAAVRLKDSGTALFMNDGAAISPPSRQYETAQKLKVRAEL